MWRFSYLTLNAGIIFTVVFSCSGVIAREQLSNSSEFLENHLRLEAKGATKVHSQFDYTVFDMLNTSSVVKMNNSGFEDHMAIGFAQNMGNSSASLMYNTHRYNYVNRDNETDDVSMDFQYRALRLQHRVESDLQVSKIALPFDVLAAHLDLSYSQILAQDASEAVDAYQFMTQFNQFKFSFYWKDAGDDTLADVSTEYVVSAQWLMKYAYRDDGTNLQRKLRSEYRGRDFSLSGELTSQTNSEDQTYLTSAISIEKKTELAALKMRLEYATSEPSSALFFEVKSDRLF